MSVLSSAAGGRGLRASQRMQPLWCHPPVELRADRLIDGSRPELDLLGIGALQIQFNLLPHIDRSAFEPRALHGMQPEGGVPLQVQQPRAAIGVAAAVACDDTEAREWGRGK